MANKAPGKHYRKGISLIKVVQQIFPDNDTAMRWFEGWIWKKNKGEPICPKCGSVRISKGQKHPSFPYRCKDCRKCFSVRTGTAMKSSKLSYQVWAIAIYLVATNLKGMASLKFHRELDVNQKHAWHLAHRIRMAWKTGEKDVFEGPVEVDEATTDGIVSNMSNKKQREWREKFPNARGMVGKTVIIAMFDRKTGKTIAEVMEKHDKESIQEFVLKHTEPGCLVITDGSHDYRGLPDRKHESVSHNKKKYAEHRMVDGKLVTVSTNNVETFWSMLKRGHQGVFHKISPKQLQRYVDEATGHRNVRSKDTADIMGNIAKGLSARFLTYNDLTADNGYYSAGRGCDPKVDKRLIA